MNKARPINNRYGQQECWDYGYEQGRADALKPIAKIIDDYACGRELHVINAINNYIYEQTKEQKNE